MNYVLSLSRLHGDALEGRQIPESNFTQYKCVVKSMKSLLLRRAVVIAVKCAAEVEQR